MNDCLEAGSQPQPADTQASNGEIVPDDDASAQSLRHGADTNPASDRESLGEHVQQRRAEEPTGVTRESAAGSPADVVEGATAEELAAVEAGGELTSAPGDRTEIEGPNSA